MIVSEILQPSIVGLSWVTQLFNVTWKLRTVPLEWKTWVVVTVFKKDIHTMALIIVISQALLPWGVFSFSLHASTQTVPTT